MRKSRIFLFMCVSSILISCTSKPQLKLEEWTIERTNANSIVNFQNDTIDILTTGGGLTLWYNKKLEGNYVISYDGCIVMEGCEYDRLSDFNCFWAASDPKTPNNLFSKSEWREGKLHNYYLLNLYYVGYGGNENTTTRFRKYLGREENPPLLQEYRDKDNLLEPNLWYQVEIRVDKSKVQFLVNDKVLFVQEKELLNSGHFGFRTFNNHMKITNFKVLID